MSSDSSRLIGSTPSDSVPTVLAQTLSQSRAASPGEEPESLKLHPSATGQSEPDFIRVTYDATFARVSSGLYLRHNPESLSSRKRQLVLFLFLQLLGFASIAVATWALASGFAASGTMGVAVVGGWFGLLMFGGITHAVVNYLWPLRAKTASRHWIAFLTLTAEHFGGTMASLATGYALSILDFAPPAEIETLWNPLLIAAPVLALSLLLFSVSTFVLRRTTARVGHQLDVTTLEVAEGIDLSVQLPQNG